MTDEDIEALAEEAERGYELSQLTARLWFCPRRPAGAGVDSKHLITWEGKQARCSCGETRLPE